MILHLALLLLAEAALVLGWMAGRSERLTRAATTHIYIPHDHPPTTAPCYQTGEKMSSEKMMYVHDVRVDVLLSVQSEAPMDLAAVQRALMQQIGQLLCDLRDEPVLGHTAVTITEVRVPAATPLRSKP